MVKRAGWRSVDGLKQLRRNIRGKGVFWLHGPNRSLAEHRSGSSVTTREVMENEESCQIWSRIRCGRGRGSSCQTDLARFLLTVVQADCIEMKNKTTELQILLKAIDGKSNTKEKYEICTDIIRTQ